MVAGDGISEPREGYVPGDEDGTLVWSSVEAQSQEERWMDAIMAKNVTGRPWPSGNGGVPNGPTTTGRR